MDKRQQELLELKGYIEAIDKETTLLLQNLQWDHKYLIGSTAMVSCKYVANHRIPADTREAHEQQCYLTQQGYNKADVLLPEPIDPDANTIVKLSRQDIMQIINKVSSSKSLGVAHPGAEPLSLERLQQVYSAEERRAIHDAVVSAAPFCHDLADLALASSSDGRQASKEKSREEILAELRDMKRRRAKYRVAAKTANYSDMLRDVIKTQMDLYAEAKGIVVKTEYGPKTFVSLNMPREKTLPEKVSTDLVIKQERVSPEADNYSEGSRRYRERSRSRERHYDHYKRKHEDRGREHRKRRGHYDDKEKRRYKDYSQDRDKYASKERRRYDEGQSKREEYERIKEVDTSKDRHDDRRKSNNKLEWGSSKDAEDLRKSDRSYGNGSTKNKYDADSRQIEKRDRSYKEYSSNNNSKYDDYYRKHDENQKTYQESDSRREHKHKRYHDVKIKEEKDDDYDDYTDERNNRKRYS